MSKYGVFFWSLFSRICFEYEDLLRKSWWFSPNAGKYGPEKTPYLDSFQALSNLVIFITATNFCYSLLLLFFSIKCQASNELIFNKFWISKGSMFSSKTYVASGLFIVCYNFLRDQCSNSWSYIKELVSVWILLDALQIKASCKHLASCLPYSKTSR